MKLCDVTDVRKKKSTCCDMLKLTCQQKRPNMNEMKNGREKVYVNLTVFSHITFSPIALMKK